MKKIFFAGNTSISSQHHKTSPHAVQTTKSPNNRTSTANNNTSSATNTTNTNSSNTKTSNSGGSVGRAPVVPPRNAALISAAKKSLNDPSAVNRREELARRIEETKKQLESVSSVCKKIN